MKYIQPILEHSGKIVLTGFVAVFLLPVVYGGIIRLPDFYRWIKRKIRKWRH